MKKLAVALGVISLVVLGWATAAGALEGGFLTTLDGLERAAENADFEADDAARRTAAMDEYLQERLTDADTARRATETLRRDVSTEVAAWDRARRVADRAVVTDGPREGRAIHRALDSSREPAMKNWQRQVRLLADVAVGVEHAGNLLTRRAQLGVLHAQWRGEEQKAVEERRLLLQRINDGTNGDEVRRELHDSDRQLEENLEDLDRNPTTEDFHRRKGALLPPVSATPDHLFGPRRQESSISYIRHTGLTYFVEQGTEVRAVAPGIVVQAERLVGYGRMVIVDHGGGYHSIYAHLENIEVAVDDEIPARRVLGMSGQSGSLEGPKLYFELRFQGRPLDPQEWFVRQ